MHCAAVGAEVLLSERLRTYIRNEFWATRAVREIGRGQIVWRDESIHR